MRFKMDFVTNSSSASFVIMFKHVDGDHELDSWFVSEFTGDYAYSYAKENNEPTSKETENIVKKIEHVGGGVFKASEWTSMNNGMDSDTWPQWILRLYMELSLKLNSDYELVSADVESD